MKGFTLSNHNYYDNAETARNRLFDEYDGLQNEDFHLNLAEQYGFGVDSGENENAEGKHFGGAARKHNIQGSGSSEAVNRSAKAHQKETTREHTIRH